MRAFISYKTDGLDEEYAIAIEQRLEQLGHTAFRDASDLKTGQAWRARLRQEIEACDVFISIVSNRALKSPWVVNEIQLATTCKKKIAPLLLEELSRENTFDFYNPLLEPYQAVKSTGEVDKDVRRLVAEAVESADSQSDLGKPVETPKLDVRARRSFFDLTTLVIMACLLIVSVASCWSTYGQEAEAWDAMHSHFDALPRLLNGRTIDLLRVVVVILPGTFLLGEFFGFELKRILGIWRKSTWRFDSDHLRKRNLRLLGFRAAYVVVALWMGSTAAAKHIDVNQQAKQLVEEFLATRTADWQATSYAILVGAAFDACYRFTPYVLAFYAGLFPLLIIVPTYALVERDATSLRRRIGRWPALLRARGREPNHAFAPMTEDLRFVASRYLSLCGFIALAVHFECWLGRFTGFIGLPHLRLGALIAIVFAWALYMMLTYAFEQFRRRTWGQVSPTNSPMSHRWMVVKPLLVSPSGLLLMTAPISIFLRYGA